MTNKVTVYNLSKKKYLFKSSSLVAVLYSGSPETTYGERWMLFLGSATGHGAQRGTEF